MNPTKSWRSTSAAPPAGPTRLRTTHRTRWLSGLLTAVTALGTTVLLAPPAAASFSSFQPVDPATGFPSSYTDGNGLALELCLGLPLCLSDTDLVAVHEAGGDAEAFYWAADATAGGFEVHLALEAAYAAEGPGQEVVFQRTQVRLDDSVVLPANTDYTVRDPYGTFTCTTDGEGGIDSNGCRIETTPVEGEFGRALPGRLGPFLTWDTFGTTGAGAPPAGYIGDNATPHRVVGSPTGFNAVRITGPGLRGTCAGGTIANCVETDLWVVQGRVKAGGASASLSAGVLAFGDVPATPPVTRSLTYANTGDTPVSIGSIGISGTGATAFRATDDCPDAPATLGVGDRCTIDVTYTPDPGRSSAATLTVTDDTPVGTRTVALTGSNLPRMVVAAPVPPSALAFGNQSVGADSPQDNVVIGNTGNGPLTVVSKTISGASAAHFRLGTNDTCTAAVAPDGGCEIGVVFRPTTSGGKSATLRVEDATGAVVTVPLSGTGVTARDVTAPTAPSLSGSLAGSTANLSWTAATDNVGVTGYRVFRGATQVGTTTATTRSFSQANLPAGRHAYAVRAVDAAGNVSAASNTVTLTVPAANTAPVVTARTPAANAFGVGVGSNVTATFSEPVTGTSATTVVLKNPAGATIPAVVGYNGTTRVVTLNPNVNLAADTRYTVTLTGGATAIRDSGGTPLATTSWSFLTGPRPAVTARTPAPNATGVARAANVTATFSEAITGWSGTTVTLRPTAAGGTNVGAVVTYNATTRVVTLNPNANLAANTQYRATVTTGIRDAAGNPLAANNTWTFTTGAA